MLLKVNEAEKTVKLEIPANPEIINGLRAIYSACGLSLEQAIDIFFQQSINCGGLPFLLTRNSREALRDQAVSVLMSSLENGAMGGADWISEDEANLEIGDDIWAL